MDSVDALKVYATVEKAALKFRWKGQRGPPAPTGLSAAAAEEDEVALQARRRAFLLRDERQEQQKAILLERRKHAAAHVRKALKEKAKEFVISRPLRRFGMKLAVRLVHHAYDAKTKCETVSNRMVVMEDSVKFEALDGWVRTCLGSDKSSAKLKYQYVTLNGHPTVLDTKTALQNWLDEIDGDGNGSISLVEMTNMILEMDLHTLGVTKDEIANYVSDEFERVDRDGSGEIDFDEFKAYYESLQEFLKDKLSIESKHTHMYTKFREEYMEARSKQLPLGDLVAICAEAHSSAPNAAVDPSPDASPDASAAGMGLAAARSLSEGASGLVASVDGGRSGDSDGSTALNPISGALCARLTLEAHGHDFGVEVLVPPSAVGDGMRGHWIRAETVIQAQVDYFSDGTVGLGQALSPTVCVELEQPSSGPRPELRDDYTVVLPLCVGSCMDDKSEIAKGDLAVCFGRWQTVFSRTDHRKPRTRVRCVAYLPRRMSHLELHRLRIYVCQAIPDELESLTVREQHDRGSVSVGGKSKVFELSYGERLSISVGVKDSEGGQVQTHSLSWKGEVEYVDIDFDPAELHALAAKRSRAEGDVAPSEEPSEGGAGVTLPVEFHGALQITVAVEDLRSRMRRGSVFGGPGKGGKGGGQGKVQSIFPCAVTVQEFAPPAAPTNLGLVHRTNASLAITFDPPRRWGGCALDRHEVEMCEIKKDGKYHEKGWVQAQEIPAGRAPITQIACRVYMAEVRVRTWNIASERPSEWSDVFKVSEPLEGSRRPSEEKRGVEKSGASKTDVLRAAREEEKAVLKKTKSTVEGGLATVIQLGTDEQFMVKHTMTGVAHMEAQGWSAFRRAIGGLLIEMGVYGGCEGRLFDFSAEDLEGLVSHGDDPKLHVAKPLFSLATIGGYVLQTLSQHAVVETEAWVRLASEIAMLVDLASATEEEEVTRPMVSSLLAGLVDVYESLVQCEEDGYVARQLEAKYEKGLKQLLRHDWEEQMGRLRNRLATDAMGLVLYERLKRHTK